MTEVIRIFVYLPLALLIFAAVPIRTKAQRLENVDTLGNWVVRDRLGNVVWRSMHSSEDVMGYLARIKLGYCRELAFPPQDGLTFKEREKKYRFTSTGLDGRLPLMDLGFLDFHVKGMKGSVFDVVYGKARTITQRQFSAIELFPKISLYTPGEYHRCLAELAKVSNSDRMIDKETGVDMRYRFHVIVYPRHDSMSLGPQFNPATGEVEGELIEGEPIIYGTAIIYECVDPELQKLLLALAENPDGLTEAQKLFNGVKKKVRYVNHFIPDSYRAEPLPKLPSPTPTLPNIPLEKREKYEIDLKAGFAIASSEMMTECSAAEFAETSQLTTKLANPKQDPDELKDLCLQIRTARMDDDFVFHERIWVKEIKRIGKSNVFEGVVDNEKVIDRTTASEMKPGERERIKFEQFEIADAVYIQDGRIVAGATIREFLQRVEHKDREELKKLCKHQLN